MFLEVHCCRCKPWLAEQAWMLHSHRLDNSQQNVSHSLAILTAIPCQWLLPWSVTRPGGPWPGKWNVGEKFWFEKGKRTKTQFHDFKSHQRGQLSLVFLLHTCAFVPSLLRTQLSLPDHALHLAQSLGQTAHSQTLVILCPPERHDLFYRNWNRKAIYD